MPSFAEILSLNRSFAIPFGGVTVSGFYDPNVITPRLEEEMKAASANGESVKQFLAVLCKWIVSWDLTENAPEGGIGEPIPITVERLMDFPDNILSAISKGIMADMRPNPTNS